MQEKVISAVFIISIHHEGGKSSQRSSNAVENVVCSI